jgi:hypothetical protein
MKKIVLILFFCAVSIFAKEKNYQHFAINSGGAFAKQTDKIHPYIGFEYEYILPSVRPLFSVGIFSEYIFSEEPEVSVQIPFALHTSIGIKPFLSLGVVYINRGVAPEDITDEFIIDEEYGEHVYSVIGFGIAYEIAMPSLGNTITSLAPVIRVDLIGNNYQFIFGIQYGVHF